MICLDAYSIIISVRISNGALLVNICYKHLAQIRKSLKITASSLASSWRSIPKKDETEQGAQIDLLFDRDDDSITICEIKYTEKPFSIDKMYAKKLEDKIEAFRRATRISKQIFLVFISANGLNETMYLQEMVQGIVVLDDLFVSP